VATRQNSHLVSLPPLALADRAHAVELRNLVDVSRLRLLFQILLRLLPRLRKQNKSELLRKSFLVVVVYCIYCSTYYKTVCVWEGDSGGHVL